MILCNQDHWGKATMADKVWFNIRKKFLNTTTQASERPWKK
jgi:hypothetical protein